MSKIDEATENPNDKMPAGKPLSPDKIVPEDDAGSSAIDKEVADERDEKLIADEFEGLDNDLVNVGTFDDDATLTDRSRSAGGQAGDLPDERGIEKSNTLRKP